MIETIKNIILALGIDYYRALDTNDLSQQVLINKINTIGVHAGSIEIDASFSPSTYNSIELWDVRILFLVLAPQIDTPAEEIDALLDPLYELAHDFIGALTKELPSAHFLEGYELKSTDSVNITSEVLIGWELTLKAPWRVSIC